MFKSVFTKKNTREASNKLRETFVKFTDAEIDANFLARFQRQKSRERDGLVPLVVRRRVRVEHGLHNPIDSDRVAVGVPIFIGSHMTAEVELVDSSCLHAEDSSRKMETSVLSVRLKVEICVANGLPLRCLGVGALEGRKDGHDIGRFLLAQCDYLSF